MLIEKPQFDLNKVLPGTALFLTKIRRGYKELEVACIVKLANPLEIVVSFYNDKTHSIDTLTVKVSDITDKCITLQPMVVERPI